jgi:hypothetical protein
LGMICTLYSVPDDSAGQLIADPSRIHELLESLREEGGGVSLEKSWHGLHFALTGSVWGGDPPLNFLAGGGDPVGTEDVGCGPARLLLPDQVERLDSALCGVSDEDFARGFDLAEMEREGVYPQIWDEPLEDLLQEYGEYLAAAKELVRQASRDGHGLLIVVN